MNCSFVVHRLWAYEGIIFEEYKRTIALSYSQITGVLDC